MINGRMRGGGAGVGAGSGGPSQHGSSAVDTVVRGGLLGGTRWSHPGRGAVSRAGRTCPGTTAGWGGLRCADRGLCRVTVLGYTGSCLTMLL